MSQNKLKMFFGIAAISFAIIFVALLLVGILAISADTALFVKVLVLIIAVLCLLISGELAYMYLLENESAPNFFLYNNQNKRNIPVQKLTFQMINGRMNRFLAGYASSVGKLWTDRVLDNPYLEMEDKFKPAVAYKLLYDLAEKDTELAWNCFELASDETVEFLCVGLEMNQDMELARTLRQMKQAQPMNIKYVRDYLVNNRNYLKNKLSRYIYDNIRLF